MAYEFAYGNYSRFGARLLRNRKLDRLAIVVYFSNVLASPLAGISGAPRELLPRFESPKLPENFERLDSGDKEIATREKEQASRAKAYEVSTFRQKKIVYDTFRVPQLIRELFLRCGDTWDDGIIPLRECLISISCQWSGLGFSGTCPFLFTDEQIRRHETE